MEPANTQVCFIISEVESAIFSYLQFHIKNVQSSCFKQGGFRYSAKVASQFGRTFQIKRTISLRFLK